MESSVLAISPLLWGRMCGVACAVVCHAHPSMGLRIRWGGNDAYGMGFLLTSWRLRWGRKGESLRFRVIVLVCVGDGGCFRDGRKCGPACWACGWMDTMLGGCVLGLASAGAGEEGCVRMCYCGFRELQMVRMVRVEAVPVCSRGW